MEGREWKAAKLRPVNKFGEVMAALTELQQLTAELVLEGNYDAAALSLMCCQQLVHEGVHLVGEHNQARNLEVIGSLLTKLEALASLVGD